MKYSFDIFELDTDSLVLYCKGEKTDIDLRCIELLVFLIETWPGYCEPQQLLQHLWPRTIVSNWSLSRLVSDCRKSLKKAGYNDFCIQTLHSKGYRLAPELAAKIFVSDAPAVINIVSMSKRRSWLLPALPLSIVFISAFWLFPGKELKGTNGPSLLISEAPGTVARVLWVDDNPDNNKTEAEYFRRNNIAVYAVTSTADAMLLLSLYRYDAVISDMGRAGDPLSGLRLLQQMRQQNINTDFFMYSIMPSEEKQQLLTQYGGQGLATESEQLYQLVLAALK